MQNTITELHTKLLTQGAVVAMLCDVKGNEVGILTSPFINALVLQSLTTIPSSDIVKECIHILSQYLLTHYENNAWNYISTQSVTDPAFAVSVPNDLDTTTACIQALYDHTLLRDEMLAEYVKKLTEAEICPGGPYKTWLLNDPSWNSVDTYVNQRISRLMRTMNIPFSPTIPGTESVFYSNKAFARISLFEPTDMELKEHDNLFLHSKGNHGEIFVQCPILTKLLMYRVHHNIEETSYTTQEAVTAYRDIVEDDVFFNTQTLAHEILSDDIGRILSYELPRIWANWIAPNVDTDDIQKWCTWSFLATITSRILDDVADKEKHGYSAKTIETVFHTFCTYSYDAHLCQAIAATKHLGTSIIPFLPCLHIAYRHFPNVYMHTRIFLESLLTLRKLHDDIHDGDTLESIVNTKRSSISSTIQNMNDALRAISDISETEIPKEIHVICSEYTYLFEHGRQFSKVFLS